MPSRCEIIIALACLYFFQPIALILGDAALAMLDGAPAKYCWVNPVLDIKRQVLPLDFKLSSLCVALYAPVPTFSKFVIVNFCSSCVSSAGIWVLDCELRA